MTKHGSVARCALLGLRSEWEVRVLVDGDPLYASRCAHAKDVFSLAEEWKARLSVRGWTLVVPHVRRKALDQGVAAHNSGTT